MLDSAKKRRPDNKGNVSEGADVHCVEHVCVECTDRGSDVCSDDNSESFLFNFYLFVCLWLVFVLCCKCFCFVFFVVFLFLRGVGGWISFCFVCEVFVLLWLVGSLLVLAVMVVVRL